MMGHKGSHKTLWKVSVRTLCPSITKTSQVSLSLIPLPYHQQQLLCKTEFYQLHNCRHPFLHTNNQCLDTSKNHQKIRGFESNFYLYEVTRFFEGVIIHEIFLD